ncbi:MAG: TonB-dependent receptor [Acidobacteria bacterium]|nr:TonB-dependent receptor [Acidobacteriota bacterium]
MAPRLCRYIAVGVLTLFPSLAAAQVINAEITGSVSDESGGVLPGASLTAHNTQTGLERSAVTDENGRYRLMALTPGAYTIRTELAGFATERREGVTLTINLSLVLNFTLKLATVAESVTVTGEAPLIETTKAELGKTIETQAIDSLPLNGRNFTQLATLVPGVRTAAPGTLSIGGQSLGGASGQTMENNSYSVDGVDNNNEVAGGRPARYSQDSIREFQVLTNQFSAEFGRASGGVVNILTRSGTNSLSGRAFYFIRDEALDATPVFARAKAPFRRQQFGGTLGGPIVRDRTHYFVSLERLTEDRVSSVVTPALRADYPQPTHENLYFTKVTQQLGAKHSVQLSYNGFWRGAEGLSIGGPRLPSNGTDSTGSSQLLVMGQTSVLSPKTLHEFRFGLHRQRGRNDPRDPVGPEIRRPSSIEGRRDNSPGRSVSTRYQFIENLTRNFEWSGDHSLKVGTDIAFFRGHSYLETWFGGVFVFTTDRPFDPNDLTTYPSQYTVRTGDPNLDTPNNILAFYATDRWTPHNKLTLTLGVRYDLEVGTVDNVMQTDKDNVAPRLAFAWTPLGDRTVVRGGYGLFFDQIFQNLSWNIKRAGAPPPLGIGVTRTFVLRNPGFPDPYSRPTTPAVEDGAISDGKEVSPYAIQASVGISRQLTATVAVSADYVRVRGHHIARNFDYNVVDPQTGQRPRPQFGKIYSYETGGKTWYDGLQTSFEKRLSRGHQFLVSYTLSKSMDDTWASFVNLPLSAPQSYFDLGAEKAVSEHDERHRLAASGRVHLPLGFQLGAIFTAASGRPYNILTGRDNNLDANFTDRPNFDPASGSAPYVDPGVGLQVKGNAPRNSGRGAAFASLDLRLSKIVKIRRTSIEMMLEAFNVTNRDNFSAYNGNLRSALFRRPTAAFDPRQIQLGARIDF